MLATRSPSCRTRLMLLACGAVTVAISAASLPVAAQVESIEPVTDAELQDPSPDDWLMWRRTLNGWGYSPLEQIDRENVGELRMVWSRALTAGRQQGTPLVHDGVLYMPNPNDVIQAIDAVTGDLRWEHRREVPEDISDYIFGLSENNRNLAIHGTFIIDTSVDDHVFALDAATGRLAWETEILDYRVDPAMQTSGPIVAGGKVISGRSCMPVAGPEACVVTAHDARTGAEVWRTRLIPAPGEPGDESWGGVPFEERRHVGAWMVPSYDPVLNLIYVGTSVTSPAPKFLLGGIENKHLYHNSTLALDGDTGAIVWYYQHLNDHWDLDHPFERLLVDTAVAPDPAVVSWINPRLEHGEVRRVLTGIPGKTGVVYTLDRETGEFLWARPTVAQNVISAIDGATGAVTENAELIFTAEGQEVLACPSWFGGKDWESVHRLHVTPIDPVIIGKFSILTGPKRPESGWQNRKRLAVRLAASTRTTGAALCLGGDRSARQKSRNRPRGHRRRSAVFLISPTIMATSLLTDVNTRRTNPVVVHVSRLKCSAAS